MMNSSIHNLLLENKVLKLFSLGAYCLVVVRSRQPSEREKAKKLVESIFSATIQINYQSFNSSVTLCVC
ncbi:hypothetical protein FRX31_032160 [Thalictrum thalictroides]|uniref:Uncharacterized protein n=1 Tax=Thalictrum thalictroides TaxID=46969 RepID=A0A7J6V020_THATH|nr:hypothetical protein FRX31_032160 [Thalictrum thalictroides]